MSTTPIDNDVAVELVAHRKAPPPPTLANAQLPAQVTSEWVATQSAHLAAFKSPALVKSLTESPPNAAATTTATPVAIAQSLKPQVDSALALSVEKIAPAPAPRTTAQQLSSTVAQFVDIERQHADVPSDYNEAEDTASSIESVIAVTPSATLSTSTLRIYNQQKPSLLPKPKVKVLIPPALLLQQTQQQQEEQQRETSPTTASSRIPIRTVNAERRALKAAAAAVGGAVAGAHDEAASPDVVERSPDAVQHEQSQSNVSKSKAIIK